LDPTYDLLIFHRRRAGCRQREKCRFQHRDQNKKRRLIQPTNFASLNVYQITYIKYQIKPIFPEENTANQSELSSLIRIAPPIIEQRSILAG